MLFKSVDKALKIRNGLCAFSELLITLFAMVTCLKNKYLGSFCAVLLMLVFCST